jgi:hypothetical protein
MLHCYTAFKAGPQKHAHPPQYILTFRIYTIQWVQSSRILVTLKSRLSTSLAKQMAQRIFGHVRGSAVHGQYSHPISALLSLSKTADSE